MNEAGSPSGHELPFMHIEVACDPGRRYKSIGDLVWNEIPALAVVTGLNGSGKTQLFELLAYKLSGTPSPQADGVNVKVSGASYTAASIAYMPSDWQLTFSAVGLDQLRSAKDQMWSQVRNKHQQGQDIRTRARIARLEAIAGDAGQTADAFARKLPDDFTFMLDDADVTNGIAHVFMGYRSRALQLLEQRVPHEEIEKQLGPAPWRLVDEAFSVAGFPYRVVPPTETPLIDVYHFGLMSVVSSDRITPSELSSGEKMILVIVMWLYRSQHHGQFARLLLMDEPDAHLHPAMTRQFFDVVYKVLVQRHGVRVLLTTHSPSTVALAPPGSVFEMSRTQPRIQPSKSIASTVGLLTAGLVVVSPDSRFVLVEDDQDVRFYDSVRTVLTDFGPRADPKVLLPAPSLVFLPASTGRGATKVSGGSSMVKAWVEKFSEAPLSDFLRGLIDHDGMNIASARIKVTGRHSIENYLADPLVVYCMLSSRGLAPQLDSIRISRGNEHLLRDQHQSALQDIVSAVSSSVLPQLGQLTGDEQTSTVVKFTNSKELSYPTWMLTRRGHDVFAAFQRTYSSSNVINYQSLESSLLTLRMIPMELADVFHQLQSS
jgi:ABC-type cobalamin/Fe3+-siderophores transport system ATPase subunit